MKWDAEEFRRKMERQKTLDARLLEKWSKKDEFKLPSEIRACRTLLEKIYREASLQKQTFLFIEKRLAEIDELLKDYK